MIELKFPDTFLKFYFGKYKFLQWEDVTENCENDWRKRSSPPMLLQLSNG